MPLAKHRAQNISFYLLLAIVGLTVVFMFLPFFKLIALGGILAVLFHPLKLRISKHVKSETLSSLMTLVLALLIIIVPIYAVGQLAFNEIFSVYNQARTGGFVFSQAEFLNHLSGTSRTVVEGFLNTAGQKISDFAGNAFYSITGLLSNIAGFVVSLILVIFTLYYFLRDGDKFKSFVESIFPLSHTHEALLVDKLELAIKGVVQGSFTVALLQGTVSTVGFYIFGVPQPLLWGVFTVLAALVPTVGTLLSLVPAILYLFITGNTGAGIGMAIWAFLSIQSIDNFISPKLIGYKTNLHPLLTLLSILGGIAMFGYLGFLIGPILMSMFIALLELYATGLKAKPLK
jgi:predicted PurR-regulated permease PerM